MFLCISSLSLYHYIVTYIVSCIRYIVIGAIVGTTISPWINIFFDSKILRSTLALVC